MNANVKSRKTRTAERVLDVIKLTAKGYNQRRIAEALGVSHVTAHQVQKKAGLASIHLNHRQEAAKELLKTTTVQTLLDEPTVDPRQKPKAKKTCRYYVASKRAECGAKVKSGNYCKTCQKKVSPNLYNDTYRSLR